MKEKKELKVSALKNGTVIDHIPAEKLFEVIDILGLNKIETTITFGTNLESKQLGKKAIIKVSSKYFEDSEINRIALIAPNAKLNIIKDYVVTEKKIVVVPDKIESIVKCMNPKCITNNESVSTKFKILSKKPISLKCHYCEKITDEDHIKII
ncbi:MAG TPA: aspartate carbamoyltransferase regulatory subunit [Bacteroidales bacterium]|nr:aspartate carbamoyltransferase regulatory subunit [Bacteroidales bacterium]